MLLVESRTWRPFDAGLRAWPARAGGPLALPEEPDVFKDTGRPAPGAGGEQTPAELEPAIVLVAEDDDVIAGALALVVEDAGHVAVVAHDGQEALALARRYHPRLIITDLVMPHLDGADLIAAVRQDAATRGTTPPAVVVVTAAGRARAEEAGANVIFFKPFDVERLEAAMRRLLGADER